VGGDITLIKLSSIYSSGGAGARLGDALPGPVRPSLDILPKKPGNTQGGREKEREKRGRREAEEINRDRTRETHIYCPNLGTMRKGRI
jgi:hypothetical protein